VNSGGPHWPEVRSCLMEQLPPSALATRGTWNSAAAGVMSGSSPLAEPHVNVLQLNLSLDAMGAG
jgi:hypothetical protein